MLRYGNITEVDADKGYARVTFTDDENVSGWLQFLVMGAVVDNFSHTFNINEQVACLMDENSEEGVILGALFNDKTPPKGGAKGVFRVQFGDNSVIEYDCNSHEYKLDIKGKINITTTSEVNINAVTANLTTSGVTKIQASSLDITAAVSVTGDVSVTGKITSTGDIESSGDVKAGAISLKNHKHGGVSSGGSNTTPSIP